VRRHVERRPALVEDRRAERHLESRSPGGAQLRHRADAVDVRRGTPRFPGGPDHPFGEFDTSLQPWFTAPRGGWSDGSSFQRHWITGEDEWDVTVATRGLRLTCPIDQEEDARRAAAEVARRLGFAWNESWISRARRDEF
jgi:hypothetical protein